jgi:hypothetical protein
VSNTLEDLLALVDLVDLLGEQRITALTELDDAGVLLDPSCRLSVTSHHHRVGRHGGV